MTREQSHGVFRKGKTRDSTPALCFLAVWRKSKVLCASRIQEEVVRIKIVGFPWAQCKQKEKKKCSCGSRHVVVRRFDLNTRIWRARRNHSEVKLAESHQRTMIKKKIYIGHGFYQPWMWAADAFQMQGVWAGKWSSLPRAHESRAWHKHPCVRQ